MASGSIGDDSIDDLNSRGRIRWTPHSKVYTRRIRKKVQETVDDSGSAATTSVPADTGNEISPNPSADLTNPVSASPCQTEPGIPDSSTVPIENPSCDDVPVPVSVEAIVTAEDVNPSQQRVQEGGARQDTELQRLENSPLPSSDATQNSKKPSPIHSTDKLLKTNGNGALNLRIASPLSSENDLSNAREVETSELPVRNDLQGDGGLMPVPIQVPSDNWTAVGNGNVKSLVISTIEDRIRFNLSKATPKNEIEELRKRLECELDQVRRLIKELETKEIQISSFNTPISDSNIRNINNYDSSEVGSVGGFGNFQSQHARNNLVDRRVLLRVNSNLGSIANLETRPVGLARMSSEVGAARNLEVRPYSRQLSVAVMENNQRPGEFVEKEKRTPKANQFYRKSEFLLAKDRLPPESNRRLKTNKGRKHRRESEYAFGFGFGFDKRAIKSCSSLLQRLMKHNHGWVFNEPVNAKALGLHDYHDVIKHPMDLGTIKTRLSQKWYKSPREFAEDVRLVFRNAMTYNPKGQDVHFMAEQLSQIFEERWQILETEYNPYWKYQMYLDAGLPTPTFRKVTPQCHFAPASALGSAAPPFPALVPSYAPAPVATPTPYAPDGHVRTLDRPDLIATPMAVDPIIQRPFIGRTPAPKKPKAKDPDKRDMTYDEKQKLSTNLQSLPAEKLDAIVQIIKRRSTALSQKDDEIEVDIDRVDTETLWELDRFVTNYKKSLSKYKRKAELARQARMVANQRLALTNTAPASADVQIGNGADKSSAPLAAEGETKENSASRSSSSSSSSSDSGSSSSDSDSDSSSSDGSDEGNSPKT
ncbi:transcription factor GTE4-like isoform X2 [Primulina huaijiensis]|uniref:transcription factor GTE4-like isoform X2 n=1 Tax=Primulina huaijiensis TaxID=1492673 RepID=UPI003CC77868